MIQLTDTKQRDRAIQLFERDQFMILLIHQMSLRDLILLKMMMLIDGFIYLLICL